MKLLPLVDYRQFRLSKLNSSEFSHLRSMFFWPIWALAFYIVEAVWIRESYQPVYCMIDDLIPFCEVFIIPYLFWFVFMVGMHLYSLLFDIAAFRRMIKFIMVGYTLGLVIFIIFPTCQNLRPTVYPRDNLLTSWTRAFHAFDTNTNVLPSLHVIGSVSAMLCGWDSKHFSSRWWKVTFTVTAFLVAISTVFVKQHSILDVIAAIPVCLLAWWIAYRPHNVCTQHRILVEPVVTKVKSFDASLRATALIAAYHRNHSEAGEPDMEWFERILDDDVLNKMCTESMKQQIMETIKQRLGADMHASS